MFVVHGAVFCVSIRHRVMFFFSSDMKLVMYLFTWKMKRELCFNNITYFQIL